MAEKSKDRFCVSCGRDVIAVKNSVLFKCPNCSNELSRCGRCRGRGTVFTCQVCGLIGP